MKRTMLFLAIAIATMAGCTAPPPAPAGPDPADPSAAAPAAAYRPVFGGYQPYTDQAVGNWREANDAVGRIGGWREYAREEETPAPAAGASTHGQH